MNIFVDENIPSVTVQKLRDLGHDVKDIRGTSHEGMPDESLWQFVQKEGRLLITTDKGFSEHRNESHHGILIITLKKPNENKIHKRVVQAISQTKAKDWKGLVVIVRDSARSMWRSRLS